MTLGYFESQTLLAGACPSPMLVTKIAFIALLLLTLVGVQPFSPPMAGPVFGGVYENARGDTLRQIAYLSLFAVTIAVSLRQQGFRALAAVPPVITLALAWCLASAIWAGEPDVAFRRAVLECVVVLSIFLNVQTLGSEFALRSCKIVLAAILLVNWMSIPLIPVAVHLPGEIDPALVGNWRGLYEHKNIAGGVCAMTALLFLFTKTGRGNWIGLCIAAGAIAFLVETHSKSSEALLPAAWFFGVVYRLSWRNGFERAIVVTLILLGITALGAFALINADALSLALSDPAEFTGRGAVWQAEFAFIRDHPFLGSGFGTFSETGAPSILRNYVGGWVTAASHGHNGYLQLIVTLGIIGFLLAMLGFVMAPAVQLWRLDTGIISFKPLLLSLFLFVVFHNFMETDYLEADGPVWVLFLIAIASLRELRCVERRLPHAFFPRFET